MPASDDINLASLLEDDIPVVDTSGNKSVVRSFDPAKFTPSTAVPAPVAPAAAKPVMANPAKSMPAPAAPAASKVPKLTPEIAALIPKKSEAVVPPNLPFVDELPTYLPPRAAVSGVAMVESRSDLGLEPEKDQKELTKLEAQPVVQEMEAEKKKELPLLERTVEDAVIATGASLKDEDMRRRYAMLVSLYFRGLRDSLETKSKFTMPAMSGGMGFEEAAADQLMNELESRSKQYNDALLGKSSEEKTQYVAGRTEKLLNRQDAIDRSEKEKGDTAYQGLMDRVGLRSENAMPPKPPAPPRMIPVTAADAMPVSAPVAIPVRQPATAGAATAPTPDLLRPSAARPIVADVSYAPKLTGPVEELRSITMKDFRRLSRDPREATLKIKDKIDLLEEQSFTLKTAAVKAWQESEVHRLYLEILRTSLNGKPVPDVIADLDAAGSASMTQAEFESVMELNRKLRFG